MREIKFRAWDVVELKIRKVARLDYPEWTVCVTDDYYNFQCERNSFKNDESDRFMLMQYTGLKDKNGTEIYDGDIVQQSDDLGREVVFYDGCWMLKDHFDLYDYEIENIEVIGNVYENPELLK